MHEDKLIKRMEQGDASAANELLQAYYPEILRYCIWHAPDRSLAEDAAQETFLKALRYFDHYDHRGKFKAFLYRIATNTCIDMARKKSRIEFSLDDAEQLISFDKDIEGIESDLTLHQLVKCLPREAKEIVLLRFGQDLTIREIGLVMEMPLRTVQSKLRSALKILKKKFQEGGLK